jgi:formylglycine-generating enzyme required for sulfatase activity
MMGSPEDEADRVKDEGPQHKVRITKPFYMGAFEVTQQQYETAMGRNPACFKGAANPVEEVSWKDATEFCSRLSEMDGAKYRLPTEAEWEYACRAGSTTPFYFGRTISRQQANFDGRYPQGDGRKGEDRETTIPVGRFAPNAFGLYDMHGNVWEWCQDWYDSRCYANGPADDPQGPSRGSDRVVRGGSWSPSHEASHLRSAARGHTAPTIRRNNLGIRVVVGASQ